MLKEGLLVGKIVGVHGVKGTLKVHSYAESISIFETGRSVRVGGREGRPGTYTIEWAKPHKRIVLLSLKGVKTVESARDLVGAELSFDQIRLPELEEGSYYWFDIIGASVYAADRTYLGRVESIIPTGGNDVFVVRLKEKEILVPALESVVLDVDIERKTMQVDLPEGL